TPAKFTKPDGTSVEIDKKDRSKVEVPMETAREVIKVGRLTAHAQICELPEDQIANYRSLMRREEAKGKWTEQQIIYINQLRLTPALRATVQVKLLESAVFGKDAVVNAADDDEACTSPDASRRREVGLFPAHVGPGSDLNEILPAAQGQAALKKERRTSARQ